MMKALRLNGKVREADWIEADVKETEAILHHMNKAALEEVDR